MVISYGRFGTTSRLVSETHGGSLKPRIVQCDFCNFEMCFCYWSLFLLFLLHVYKFALTPTIDYTVHLQGSTVTELGKKFLVFMQPKVHRRVHNGLRLGPVLRQTDAVKISTPWSSDSHYSSRRPD
jgi:hypothetical protein